MSKHTEGDCTVRIGRQTVSVVIGPDVTSADDAILTLCHDEDRDALTIANANELAHRWNAFPDLLAACKGVVEEDGFQGSALMRKRIDAMKAALAKAESR